MSSFLLELGIHVAHAQLCPAGCSKGVPVHTGYVKDIIRISKILHLSFSEFIGKM